ncbi:MAG: CRTAC1 family protein, partial [Phaeodactylibacter sp.]|nr:CRTAC1 family protein [Phaeodactylibacter sp.]
DVFFTSNMGPNKLFLNKGKLQFEDVTEKAGLQGQEGWTSGCTAVDINNDGLLDLYVSQLGDHKTIHGSNQFYICTGVKDGIPVFVDEAAKMGVDLKGFATQATFFDYDLDGDLDLFQLNHSVHQNGTFGPRKEFNATRHAQAGDRLFRNNMVESGSLTFTDVTTESGIISTVLGYGLGVATSDINLDGWPDIYVANDFHENDYLYLNQQDGTFREVLTEQIRHTSRFSMGVDMADINNDGRNEIITTDMLPEDPFILKTSLGEDGYDIFRFKLGYGYHPQFARNNLQLNLGAGNFSEIGMFAGIEATDWSWAALFLDFDSDGYKDLFISNGIPRRMNDIDYINYRQTEAVDVIADASRIAEQDLSLLETMPQIKLPNKFFRNTGKLKFEDLQDAVRNNANSFSNGAAYADFDQDGDLDIVVNNIDNPPYLYQNLSVERGLKTNQAYLNLTLTGSPHNRQAIGARAIVFKKSEQLAFEHYPVRGYQSSMAPGLYMGLGDPAGIDSILLIWPDGRYEKLPLGNYNQSLERTWSDQLPLFDFSKLQQAEDQSFSFIDISQRINLNYTHEENPFVDFNREPLMPHLASAEGPALAIADVNGDGLEDVYIGSAKRQPSV